MEVNAENSLTGYLHNVSPIKKSNDTLYLEIQIQAKDNVLRGVCFSQSNEKCDEFDSASKRKSPVKINTLEMTKVKKT